MSENFKELMILGFLIFSDKCENNLPEILHKFKKKIEIFGINSQKFLRYFDEILEKIVRKFWRNLREIENNILTDSRKITETLLGKTEVIRNWWWRYYEEILENFFEVIWVKSKKLGRNLMKIMKKYRKHFAQTLKKYFDGNFVKFSRWFLEELAKNYEDFIEKLQRNPEEILEIFSALSKICPGALKA